MTDPFSLSSNDINSAIRISENKWKMLIISLSGIVLLFTLYCLSSGITIIFMHLFYFPIILLAYHYHKKGILLSGLLGALYVLLVVYYLYPDTNEILGAFVRFIAFVGIATVVALLSIFLERQKTSYQAIFNNANSCILVLDPSDMKIVDANPECHDFLGYEKDDLTGLSLSRICKENKITPEFLNKITVHGNIENYEIQLIGKDQTEKTALISTGVASEDRIVLICTDVTEKTKLRDEISELNQIQNSIISNANVWLMLLDRKGNVRLWNKAAEELSGYPESEVIGANNIWKKLYPDPEYRRNITDQINEIIISQNFLQNFETTIHTREGKEKVILWNTRGLYDESGVVSSYVGIGVDITGTVEIKKALQESEEKFRGVAERSSDIIMVTDQNGTTTYISPSVMRILGYEPEEMMETTPNEFVHPEDLEQAYESIKRAASGEITEKTIFRVKKKNGEYATMDMSISPIIENGVFKGMQVMGKDVTETMDAKKALEESEEKFRGVAERSSDIIMLTDESGLVTYISPSVRRIIGVEPDYIVGKCPGELINPEDTENAHEAIKRVASGENDVELHVRLKKKDGGYATIEMTGSPITENGVFKGIQVMGRDVTERKAAQERIESLLSQQEEQLYVINNSPAIAFLWKAEENWPVETVSDNISLFGYSPDDFVSGRILYSSIIHPDDLERVAEEVEYNSENHIDEFSQSYRIFGKDGKEYWTDDFTRIRRNESGEITHYQGIVLDITERKKSEEALAREKANVDYIIESLPGICYILDKDGRFVRWNENFENVTGYSEEKISKMNPLGFLPEEYHDDALAIIQKVFHEGYAEWEVEILTKDQKRIPYFLTGNMKLIDGVPHILGIGLDILDRKKAEEALKEVNRKLNLLGSITRHDILNQVMGAEGLIQLLQMSGEVPEDSKTDEYLTKINGAVDTIKRQILFTKDYKDLGNQEPKWYNVGKIIENVSEINTFGELKVENEVMNLEIYVDPLFEKVIFNLFDNAVKHGEKITTIKFTSEETPEGLNLICEDDGVGVPVDVKEKIFNRQYYKNTGLGLFLSREILGITGLSISETGTPGKGARFEIIVPNTMYRLV